MTQADRREFEAVAYPLLDSAYRTALRLTGKPTAAEDLVQEAYLRSFRHFNQFQRGTNFKAWFFRILTNAFLNEHRRAAFEPKSYDFTEEGGVDPAAEPEVVTVEDIEKLRGALGDEPSKALDRLPVDYRAPFLLSTFENFSYKEIAEILGIPIGTVMSRLFRARRLLRGDLLQYAKTSGYLKERPA